MDTPNTDAAAAPSPAPPPADLSTFTEAELSSWRSTGKYPDPTSTPAEIDAAKPAEQATSTDVQTKAASEPAMKDKTEQRFQKLLQERAQERERADRLERELAALRAPAPPADATPAASSPATATDPEPNPDDLTKYPDGAYDRKYFKDQAAWEARQVLRTERETAAQAARQQRMDARQREQAQSWGARVTAAQAKHADFDAKAFGPTEIEAGSPIDVWVMESEQGAELLYHLQTHPEEIRRIAALPAVHQVRELTRLEDKLVPAPAKTITDAPDPPRTLGSKATIVGDEEAAALKANDWERLRDLRNARDLARRRA